MTLDEAKAILRDQADEERSDACGSVRDACAIIVTRLAALERVAAAAEAYLEVQGGLGDDEARDALTEALADLRSEEVGREAREGVPFCLHGGGHVGRGDGGV